MQNGSYHFKSARQASSDCIVSDNVRISNTNYLVFYLKQPDLLYAEITFEADGKSWTETYETDGLFWVEKPAYISYPCKVEYHDKRQIFY